MLTLGQFFEALKANPLLALAMALIAGTIFVNGSTDAANSIAEAVGTRSISFRKAVVLAAIGDFSGLVFMTFVSTAVADTINSMVNFGEVGIVVWGVAAWQFGIPTSESHALIAGLTGAAIAVHGNLDGVNMSEWSKVIWGLVLSTVMGFALGWCLTRAIRWLWADSDYRKANEFFGKVQVVGAGFGAFMHGAQDGQKFMSTAMMAIALSAGTFEPGESYPLWIMVACATIMASGTAMGGKKIVKTVGTQMVSMEKYQGAAASLSAGFALLASSLWGLPVSTTHTKSAAIMGSGASKNMRGVNWGIAKDMVMTWVMTFPGCGLIGFVLAKVFLAIF